MITIKGKDYKELRCNNCQKFVAYQNIAAGIVAFQCPRCDYLNEWVFKYLKNDENENIMVKDYQVEKVKGGEK